MARRILAIDDDASILDMYTLLFQGEGYEVQTSKAFFEDVHEIERLAPSLIILDLKASHQFQGPSLLDKIQAYLPTKHIPIIVSTASTLQEIQEQAAYLQQKNIQLLYKPFDIEELLQKIEKLLDDKV